MEKYSKNICVGFNDWTIQLLYQKRCCSINFKLYQVMSEKEHIGERGLFTIYVWKSNVFIARITSYIDLLGQGGLTLNKRKYKLRSNLCIHYIMNYLV